LIKAKTLDTNDTKKDKKLSHLDRPMTSKSNDKNRKHLPRSVANVDLPRRNRTKYRSGE
jgi:hypothetical protein